MLDVDAVLRQLIQVEGSDLHLKVGAPPLMRLEGLLRPVDPAAPPLGPRDTEAAVALLLEGHDELREAFARDGEATSPTPCRASRGIASTRFASAGR